MTEIKKVVLKTVAAEVGLEEKRLRKLLRDQKFTKADRQWSWAEDHPDLEKIRTNAKAWDAEDKAPAATPVVEPTVDNVVQFPDPDADPAAEPDPESVEEPTETVESAPDDVTPISDIQPETEAQ